MKKQVMPFLLSLALILTLAMSIIFVQTVEAKAEEKPLTFTAQEADSWVKFTMYRNSNTEYSLDNGATWELYPEGTTITLPNIGDSVQFRASSVVTDDYTGFSMGGKIAASGSLASLMMYKPDSVGWYGAPWMFANCKALTTAPELPAIHLDSHCYEGMFYNCTGLTEAPDLPATDLGIACYKEMFKGCTNLVKAPELPATQLYSECYSGMFNGCEKLTNVPELPATQLYGRCYERMFQECKSLTTPPELPATQLAGNCYNGMFEGCTNLAKAPELPATELAYACYENMFFECQSLTSIPELPATTMAEYCYSGMFYYCTGLTEAPDLPATQLAGYCFKDMFMNCFNLVKIPDLPWTELATGCYKYMFCGCNSLTEAPELPATQLKDQCYAGMFASCRAMKVAPELPATELADSCYQGMFDSCYELTAAPKLPATQLKQTCYKGMFKNCIGLTTAPALPATEIKEHCYEEMFSGCTSLTKAPALPATELFSECYKSMFSDCASLTSAPKLPAKQLGSGCYENMFANCTKLKVPPALPATHVSWYGYRRMFSGCSSLETAPKLPATELEFYCYSYMFENCTSLKIKKEKTATYCQSWSMACSGDKYSLYECWNMFNGCDGVEFQGCGVTHYQKSTTPIKAVTVTPSSTKVAVGKTLTLKGSGPSDIAYKSSNKAVATVSSTGVIKGIKPGTATITAYSKSNTANKATCKVTVKYKITYKLDGGKNSTKNPTWYTGTVTFAKPPARTGYDFKGWYSDSKFKNKITSVKNANKTVYAKWDWHSYSIKFDKNGGTGEQYYQNCRYGTEFTLPACKYTKKGCTFTGWNTKADGSGKTYANKATFKNLTSVDGKRVTLYAQWKPKSYTITYKGLLSGTKNSNRTSYTVQTATFTLSKPTCKGYTFVGWYSDSAKTKKITKIEKGSTGNKTIYAKWKTNKYKIIYKNLDLADSTKMSAVSCEYGKSVTLSKCLFKKKGHHCVGWEDSNGKIYDEQATVKNLVAKDGGEITLYPVWEKTTYKITYKNLPEGVSVYSWEESYQISPIDIALPDFVLDDYEFEGWYLDKEMTNKIEVIKAGTVGNKTLYGKFTPKQL